MEPKICFLSEANYPNYVRRIKEYNLKRYLESGINVPFYISTNMPHLFQEYENHEFIKVFDINDLRKNDFFSKKNEILPDNPEGLYPSRYPWNLRRFIIRKAAEDGYNALFFLECDTKIKESISSDDLLNVLRNLYEEDCVKTSSDRYKYADRHPNQELFSQHDSYIRDLNLNFDEKEYDTLDGTNQLFFGKDSNSLLKFVQNWDTICNYGYTVENGYNNGYLSNLSFVIPMSGYRLINTITPFVSYHIPEDRYLYSNETPNSVSSESVKTESFSPITYPLIKLLQKYKSSKITSGVCDLYENFFTKFRNQKINLLELGIGTIDLNPPEGHTHVPANMAWWKEQNKEYMPGNSLRIYKEYFDNGQIYGIDFQKDCEINEDRIKTFIFDYRYKTTCDSILGELKFDIIIDDGDCDPNIRIVTLNNFLDYLTDDGLYFIENPWKFEVVEDFLKSKKLQYFVADKLVVISKGKIDSPSFLNTTILDDSEQHHEIIEYANTEEDFEILGVNLANRGFFINLNKSVERLRNVIKQNEEFKIKGLNRFQALTDEMIQFSCTKSHLAVFKFASENNLECIFVAEDDFQIKETCDYPYKEYSLHDVLINVKEELENVHWDVLLLGCNPKSNLIPVSNHLAIVDNSTGAWAYIIKKNAYQYLLENLNYKRDYIAVDDYLPKLNSLGFTTLTTIPMTVGHATGFISTLQPRGPVNYTPWIQGNYDKFLYSNYPSGDFDTYRIEKYLTIVIAGHFVDNFLYYLNYLLYSLPDVLLKCRFIINYDVTDSQNTKQNRYDLEHFFKNNHLNLNVSIFYSNCGLICSYKNSLEKIKTKYMLFLEHDWVFLKKNDIDFNNVISAMKNNQFINAVWFSKDDNVLRGFDIENDVDNIPTPFELEKRVEECNLVTTCRWSNNPVIFRTEKLKYWFDEILNTQSNEHGARCRFVEDCMISYYRGVIKNNKWENIRDEWGTFLYGDIGEGPFVAHLDGSKNYTGDKISQPEINGIEFIKEHPL